MVSIIHEGQIMQTGINILIASGKMKWRSIGFAYVKVDLDTGIITKNRVRFRIGCGPFMSRDTEQWSF